jgi:hypothetical protein
MEEDCACARRGVPGVAARFGLYNRGMHPRLVLLAPLMVWTALAAQTVPAPVPPVQESASLEGRKNQRVERIHHEDRGAVIDELRYGGQTQSITIQPKADVPEYEIQPTDMARSRPADHRDGMSSATGQRVWNLFRF